MDDAGAIEPLTAAEVRHVAKLARLRLSDAEVERARGQLSGVLAYVAMLREVDVEGVEPLAHPMELHSRMEADEVAAPARGAAHAGGAAAISIDALRAMAPAMEGPYIAVPKVLHDEGGGA